MLTMAVLILVLALALFAGSCALALLGFLALRNADRRHDEADGERARTEQLHEELCELAADMADALTILRSPQRDD